MIFLRLEDQNNNLHSFFDFFENSAFSIATNKFSFILSSFFLKIEMVLAGNSSSEKSIDVSK